MTMNLELTISAVLDRAEEQMTMTNLAENTRKAYRFEIRRFFDHIGKPTIFQLRSPVTSARRFLCREKRRIVDVVQCSPRPITGFSLRCHLSGQSCADQQHAVPSRPNFRRNSRTRQVVAGSNPDVRTTASGSIHTVSPTHLSWRIPFVRASSAFRTTTDRFRDETARYTTV